MGQFFTELQYQDDNLAAYDARFNTILEMLYDPYKNVLTKLEKGTINIADLIFIVRVLRTLADAEGRFLDRLFSTP